MEWLSALDLDVEEIKGPVDIALSGVISHSTGSAKGKLFVGRKNFPADAAAILTPRYIPALSHLTQLIDSEPEKKGLAIASQFYRYPTQKITAWGVTGTNGKTTTTYLIRHLLGDVCGLIGTIECQFKEMRFPARLTTPSPIELEELFAHMVAAGCSHVAMEVSSHGLDQKRTDHIPFQKALFTNLTPDHLDYHLTLENYALAKKRLFDGLKGEAIANADDPYSALLAPKATLYGIDTPCQWQASSVRYYSDRTRFTLQGQEYELPLIGRYNVSNALAALAAVDLPAPLMAERLASFTPPPGRMQSVPNQRGIQVFIDFAHTEDALKKALQAVRAFEPERLIVVFGCGGDRDREKRPRMGKVAFEGADVVVITSDNPRSEDPAAICREIIEGIPGSVLCYVDRREAIEKSLSLAKKGDAVLIAGRGHELYQYIREEKVPFNDYEIAKKALSLLN